MNVLLVSQYFWPEDFRVNDLARGLCDRGHAVTVLTGLPNYPGGRLFRGYGWGGPWSQDHGGIRVIRVPLMPRGRGQGWRLALNYFSFAFSASLLGLLRARGHYDVIFVYEPSPITVGIPALVLKIVKKAPVVFWVQDLWPESLVAAGAVTSQRILGWVEGLVRFIYRGCNVILVQSEGFIPNVLKVGATAEQVWYFPNWAEDLYRPVVLPPNAPERTSVPKGFVVIFAGNIGAAQDFETLLAAATRLKGHSDIHWVILGDGRMRPWVEEEVARRGLGDTFHLLGRHPVEAMPRYFALADVLLVTLKRNPIFDLTIPSKLQSYLACGKPIIAGLEGEGARVVQEAGAGIVCPPESPEALANAVLELFRASPQQRATMGAQGRRFFEGHFDRSTLLTQLESWMVSAVERGQP